MDVICSERNGNLIVKINGEIDHHTADEIKSKVEREFARSSARNIVFDFAHVGFMDSSGIGMIIGRYRLTQQQGGRVFAINIGGEVGRIFEISGLKKLIPCYASIDEAEKSDEFKG